MEGRGKKEHAGELNRWLYVATRGLGETGRERVGGEIRAHYRDAVEAARREGKSLEEAEQVAIEGLGKAKKANRAFRRTYLTARDEKRLKVLESSLWVALKDPNVVLVCAFITGAFAWPLLVDSIRNPGPREALWGAFGAAVFFVSLLYYWVSRHLVKIGARDRLILWAVGMSLGMIPIFGMVYWGDGLIERDFHAMLSFVPVFSIIFSRTAYQYWRIYRKMRVLGEDESDGG